MLSGKQAVKFTEPVALARQALQTFPPTLARKVRAKWLKIANQPHPVFHGIYNHRADDANGYVLGLASVLSKKWKLPIDSAAGDEDICEAARNVAQYAREWWNTAEGDLLQTRWMKQIQLGGDPEDWLIYAEGARTEKLQQLVIDCAARGVDASDLLEKYFKGKGITRAGLLERLFDELFCRRRLRKAFARMRESVLRNDMGEVGAHKGLYVSDDALNSRRGQRARNAALMQAVYLMNELGQEFQLSELFEKSNANPAIRRAELMVRIAGFEAIAKDVGHVGEFITLTCPSAYHARHYKSGKRNEKFNGSTPRDAAAYLNRVWARIRGALDKEEIKIYGFRVAEPHHDATPHWHGLFFLEKRHVRRFRQIVAMHGCRQDPEELGLRYFPSNAAIRERAKEIQARQKRYAARGGAKARTIAEIEHEIRQSATGETEAEFWDNADFWRVRKASPRVEFTHINWKRGSAAGYIAKYIAKNIDGRDAYGNSVGVDLEAMDGRSVAETAERVDAWAALWGIRQFQQIGGPPVTVWRELRRLDVGALDEDGSDLMRAAVAADMGDWAKFVSIMGGAVCRRQKMPLETYKEDFGTLNKYGEPMAPVIRGVIEKETGFFKIGRVHEWTGVKKGGAAAAWTCVNNCTESKFSEPKAFSGEGSSRISGIDAKASEKASILDWLADRRFCGDKTIPFDLDLLTGEQLAQYRREYQDMLARERAFIESIDKAALAEKEAAARKAAEDGRAQTERLRAYREHSDGLRRLTALKNTGIAAIDAAQQSELPGKRSIRPSRAVPPASYDTPKKVMERIAAVRAAAAEWMADLEAEADEFYEDWI